jgi:hypothetical protein
MAGQRITTTRHRVEISGKKPRKPLLPMVLIGIGLAVSSAFTYTGISRGITGYFRLMREGVTTSAEVTAITSYERIRDTGERRDNLISTIRYTDHNGSVHTIDDPRPAQAVGSLVTVRYLKSAPHSPIFESDAQLLGVGGSSVVFGLLILLATAYFGRQWYRNYHRIARLLKKGVKIPGKVINIKNRVIAQGGGAEVRTYQIVVEILLPHAATPIHVTSGEFTGTAAPALYDTVVTVYVDPRNESDIFIDPSQPYGLRNSPRR